MAWTSTSFQTVLGIVREWWLMSFMDHLVNGQKALTDMTDQYANQKALLSYVCAYTSRGCPLRRERQMRGALHEHLAIWRRPSEWE